MTDEDIIIACRLNPNLVRERIREWGALVEGAAGTEEIPSGVRLRFALGAVRAADVAALAEAERDCCPFFTFTLTVAEDGLALGVTAPEAARPLVDVLLGLDAREGAR